MKYKNKDYIHIWVSDDLKKQIKEEAEKKGLPMNAYIRLILSERKK